MSRQGSIGEAEWFGTMDHEWLRKWALGSEWHAAAAEQQT